MGVILSLILWTLAVVLARAAIPAGLGRPYRPWARLAATGIMAMLLLAAVVYWAAADGLWIGGGALNM